MLRLSSTLLALLLSACAPNGTDATTHPQWLVAQVRAADADKWDPACWDDGIVYRVVQEQDWRRTGGLSNGWGMTLGDTVLIREGAPDKVYAHEFLHAILCCSEDGYTSANLNHIGHEWDGLRGDGS